MTLAYTLPTTISLPRRIRQREYWESSRPVYKLTFDNIPFLTEVSGDPPLPSGLLHVNLGPYHIPRVTEALAKITNKIYPRFCMAMFRGSRHRLPYRLIDSSFDIPPDSAPQIDVPELPIFDLRLKTNLDQLRSLIESYLDKVAPRYAFWELSDDSCPECELEIQQLRDQLSHPHQMWPPSPSSPHLLSHLYLGLLPEALAQLAIAVAIWIRRGPRIYRSLLHSSSYSLHPYIGSRGSQSSACRDVLSFFLRMRRGDLLGCLLKNPLASLAPRPSSRSSLLNPFTGHYVAFPESLLDGKKEDEYA